MPVERPGDPANGLHQRLVGRGALGGRVRATIAVTLKEDLAIFVGGSGREHGGYNGGGEGAGKGYGGGGGAVSYVYVRSGGGFTPGGGGGGGSAFVQKSATHVSMSGAAKHGDGVIIITW